MIRLGISRKFFSYTTKKPYIFRGLNPKDVLNCNNEQAMIKIDNVAVKNCDTLLSALMYGLEFNIHSFVPPEIFPLIIHETLNYSIDDLEHADYIKNKLKEIGIFAIKNGIRIPFQVGHGSTLGSKSKYITQSTIKEIKHIHDIQKMIGYDDCIILELGAIYGSKKETLERTLEQYYLFDEEIRKKIVFTNNKSYAITDLLEICNDNRIPLLYNIYQDRLHKSKISENILFSASFATWNYNHYEPIVRLASLSRDKKNSLANEINDEDIPDIIFDYGHYTLDIDAFTKQLAVQKFYETKIRSNSMDDSLYTGIREIDMVEEVL